MISCFSVKETIETWVWEKLGCGMSPWLFNIYKDGLVGEVCERPQRKESRWLIEVRENGFLVKFFL